MPLHRTDIHRHIVPRVSGPTQGSWQSQKLAMHCVIRPNCGSVPLLLGQGDRLQLRDVVVLRDLNTAIAVMNVHDVAVFKLPSILVACQKTSTRLR